MTFSDIGLVVLGAVIGFLSAWGLERLRERRQDERNRDLMKRELRTLAQASETLLDDFANYDPAGRYPKSHSFAWGGEPTLRIIRWVIDAYNDDRSRLLIPRESTVADDLFVFVHFIEGLKERLKAHLETRVVSPLPSRRVSDDDFRELRDRATHLIDKL